MISDLLTAVIVTLMIILVVYPSAKALQRAWPDWRKRLAERRRFAFYGSAGERRPATARSRQPARRSMRRP